MLTDLQISRIVIKMSTDDFEYLPVPAPILWPDANKRLIKAVGAPIDPYTRLKTFSPEQFENFVNQWVDEYLDKKYDKTEWRRGAGDKGRDIVGWLEPAGTPKRKWDNFQCKHYEKPLTPTDIYVELGKLCYHTHARRFTVPRCYYFVCNSGVGGTLADLIETPDELKRNLLENWAKYCEQHITKREKVTLKEPFKSYVEGFDFSIVKWVTPAELLKQHAETRYHDLLFGTQLRKRGPIEPPPKEILEKESRYIEQLFESYSDHEQKTLTCLEDLEADYQDYCKHFEDSRMAFFAAEMLSGFARDNLPKQEDYFADLQNRIHTGINATARRSHPSGYERLLSCVEKAMSLQIGDHMLEGDMQPLDREGICHQLANENKVIWTDKKTKKGGKR